MKSKSKREQAGFDYVRALLAKGKDRTREEENELVLFYFRCATNYQKYYRNCHMPVCRRNGMCCAVIPPERISSMRDHRIPPCVSIDDERRETCRLLICAWMKVNQPKPGSQYTGGF